jgi:alpha-galactosidase
VPYYRKRKELMEQYTREKYLGQESFYADEWPTWRGDSDKFRTKVLTGEQELKLERSHEYASYIIEALESNKPYVIHGNVANHGLIPNLPADGCVEVACLVDGKGIQPTRFDGLPNHLAALCDSNMRMFDLAATACIQRSKQMATYALMMDPLTAAVCSPAEIHALAGEMFAAEAEYLPGFE